MQSHSLLLLSGGIDSLVCLNLLKTRGNEITCSFIDYGQRAQPQELRAATSISSFFNIPLDLVELSQTHNLGPGEILGRNATLVLSTLMYTRLDFSSIVLAIHAGTPYYDCSELFVKRLSQIVSEYTEGRVELIAPLIKWHKAQIIYYAKSNDLPIHLTYSCENGGEIPCGDCLSCKDREGLNC